MSTTVTRTLTGLAAGVTLATLTTLAACSANEPSAAPDSPAASSSSSTPGSAPSSPAVSPSATGTGESTAGTSSAGGSTASAAAYRDGTYTAKGWYGGGPSSIDVDLTLQGGVISDVEVRPNATNATSLDYQTRFADAVGEEVIGRDIADVVVDRLAGSSSTPDGFNDALDQIRAQATS